MVILEGVDTLEIPAQGQHNPRKVAPMSCADISFLQSCFQHIHVFTGPLRLFNHVQGSMDNKLVHMFRFISEAREAIATRLRGAELMFVQWIVSCANDGEVVRHDFDWSSRFKAW